MEYNELRKKYPVFYYHDYEITESNEEIQIVFDFEIEGLSHFNPQLILPKPKDQESCLNLEVFRRTAFSLGMVELVSYWKIACPPHVEVRCASLDEEQVRWWKKLYFHGLGEFFYINKITPDPDTFMDLFSSGSPITGKKDTRKYQGNLIPVGGGKDSLVSLDLLSPYRKDNHAFIINCIRSALNSSEAAGYTGDRRIIVQRTLDPRMLEFNRQGYLNGHTPFSALAAFVSLLTAIVWQKEYICLSNEASANESTVKDSTVNHQYSKTFEFEQDFNKYVHAYLTDQIHYFSLLRPLSELQIMAVFSRLPQYHKVFRSCNVGQKEGVWCGHCAKCLFVAVMLGAFMDNAKITEIFGRDILNDEEMLPLFEQLTGIRDDKPFECVGTREEVNYAVCMAIRRAGNTIPVLYQAYKGSAYYEFYKDRIYNFTMFNEENLVPEEYQKIIRQRLEEL
ncbi:MAG: hypothetical protein IJJ44_02745 [Solobacterium sp.]|nr:hypothetical protein [Solobacterium sp.]